MFNDSDITAPRREPPRTVSIWPDELPPEHLRSGGRAMKATTPPTVYLGLPTREPKRTSAADRKWPFAFACELDAIPPDYMRDLVRDAIERHLPPDDFAVLKAAEASERRQLAGLVGMLDGGAALTTALDATTPRAGPVDPAPAYWLTLTRASQRIAINRHHR